MSTASYIPSLHVSQPVRPGLRVLVYEPDASLLARVERVFACDSVFVVVGAARDAAACDFLLNEYVPEIVVCREQHARNVVALNECCALVVFLEVSPQITWRERESGKMRMLEGPQLLESLGLLKARVLERKAAEIVRMMDAVRTSDAGDGPRTSDVLWVEADRNYLVLHTSDGTLRRRGTLASFLSSSPQKFVTVSRSRAVLCSHVARVMESNRRFTVLLKCGSAFPVSRSCHRHIRIIKNEA